MQAQEPNRKEARGQKGTCLTNPVHERSCAHGVGQAETINCLLKQSKSKNKCNVLSTVDEWTPMSATPAIVQSAQDGSEALEGEVFEPVELIPTMYRWTSTTNLPLPGDAKPAPRDDSDGRMKLMFSVPLPHPALQPTLATPRPLDAPTYSRTSACFSAHVQ